MKIMKTTFTLTRPLAMLTATFLFLAGMYAWQMLVRSPEPVSYTSMDESSFLSPTVESEIGRLQARLEDSPNDAEAYAFLGLARLQQVRETGDASLYALAEGALDEAPSVKAISALIRFPFGSTPRGDIAPDAAGG